MQATWEGQLQYKVLALCGIHVLASACVQPLQRRCYEYSTMHHLVGKLCCKYGFYSSLTGTVDTQAALADTRPMTTLNVMVLST